MQLLPLGHDEILDQMRRENPLDLRAGGKGVDRLAPGAGQLLKPLFIGIAADRGGGSVRSSSPFSAAPRTAATVR